MIYFLLKQTHPSYLAKLIFQMPQNKSTKFMDTVIFTLYNYASNQREEYLLLKLFESALKEEIKWGNTFFFNNLCLYVGINNINVKPQQCWMN